MNFQREKAGKTHKKKTSPQKRGDREMHARLIALVEETFKDEELAADWRSKLG